MRFSSLRSVAALLLAVFAGAGAAGAELVDFSGLTGAGGTFSSDINGDPVIMVTVSPITDIDAAGSTLEAFFGGPGLRQITQNAGSGYDVGDQSEYTLTLEYPDVFTLSTGSGTSALDDRDIVRIAPLGVAPGGPAFWQVTGAANVDVSEDADHVLTLAGNSSTDFATYVVQPGIPIAGVTITHESTVSGTTLNSHVFDVDVSGVPPAVAVPALGPAGVALLGLLLTAAGVVLLVRRRRSVPSC